MARRHFASLLARPRVLDVRLPYDTNVSLCLFSPKQSIVLPQWKVGCTRGRELSVSKVVSRSKVFCGTELQASNDNRVVYTADV